MELAGDYFCPPGYKAPILDRPGATAKTGSLLGVFSPDDSVCQENLIEPDEWFHARRGRAAVLRRSKVLVLPSLASSSRLSYGPARDSSTLRRVCDRPGHFKMQIAKRTFDLAFW